MSRAKLEWAMFKEMIRFSARHVRYAKIALALYLMELKLGRRAYVARLGFVFLQVIDDLLDGDRACDGEAYDIVAALYTRASRGQFDLHNQLDRYGAGLWVEMGRNPFGEEGIAKTLELIRTMMRDRQRVLAREVWSQDQLRTHHRETFKNSVDLTLIAIQSPLRTAEAPALLDLFGWCSTMRDLDEDLSRGLCNVPSECVPAGEISAGWRTAPIVRDWIRREYDRAGVVIDETAKQIAAIGDKPGIGVFTMFLKSMTSYRNKGAFA